MVVYTDVCLYRCLFIWLFVYVCLYSSVAVLDDLYKLCFMNYVPQFETDP